MNNYKLIIEYDGADFNGWQRQTKTKNTIQETIERSLKILLKEDVSLIGSGRTDTGVHAFDQVANFKTSKSINVKFLYSLNSLLPKSISIKHIEPAGAGFNSRYDAKEREYVYYFSPDKKAVFREYFTKVICIPDAAIINKALKIITGKHSFKSLCKNKTDKHNFECDVKHAEFRQTCDNEYMLKISASRFLHSMIRGIAGAMMDISRGKITIKEFEQKFKKGEKIKTTYLPPNGLFLNKIYY